MPFTALIEPKETGLKTKTKREKNVVEVTLFFVQKVQKK